MRNALEERKDSIALIPGRTSKTGQGSGFTTDLAAKIPVTFSEPHMGGMTEQVSNHSPCLFMIFTECSGVDLKRREGDLR